MPLSPNEYMSSMGVSGQADSLAVCAFHHNQNAVDLISSISKYQFDTDEDRWKFQSQPFLQADMEDQLSNLVEAFKEALLADKYISRSVLLYHKFTPKKESNDVNLENDAERKAKQIERKRAKAAAASRHGDNYKKQDKVIEVYLSGDYRERFNTPNKKTETATIILNHVNTWAETVGIQKYQLTVSGGVKTIIKTIHNYEKASSSTD